MFLFRSWSPARTHFLPSHARVWFSGAAAAALMLGGSAAHAQYGAPPPVASRSEPLLGRRTPNWVVARITTLDQAPSAPERSSSGDLARSPDGTMAVRQGEQHLVALWDVAGRRVIDLGAGHTADLSCAAFSPDNTQLATGSVDGVVLLRDLATGEIVDRLDALRAGEHPTQLRYGPEGLSFEVVTSDHRLVQLERSRAVAVASPVPALAAPVERHVTTPIWEAPRSPVARTPARPEPTEVVLPIQAPAAPPPAMCEVRLKAEVPPAAAGCWIDERVGDQEGVLRYPCAGGAAVATFGASRLTGQVHGDRVTLQLHTRFPWPDRCDWGSTQTVKGHLTQGQLRFRYDEAPTAGRSCDRPCHAEATLTVLR